MRSASPVHRTTRRRESFDRLLVWAQTFSTLNRLRRRPVPAVRGKTGWAERRAEKAPASCAAFVLVPSNGTLTERRGRDTSSQPASQSAELNNHKHSDLMCARKQDTLTTVSSIATRTHKHRSPVARFHLRSARCVSSLFFVVVALLALCLVRRACA